jgi:hypothetical protein
MDLSPITQFVHTLWSGNASTADLLIVWVLCTGAHLSILKWWGTDLPAFVTRYLVSSPIARRVLQLDADTCAAVTTHKSWNRVAWLIWLNSAYCGNDARKMLIAHMLSCTTCLSFHVGYAVALGAWACSLTTPTQLGLVHCVILTLATPGVSLTLLGGARPVIPTPP